jgi:hypothetical protein
VAYTVVRPLTAADIALLATERAIQPPDLVRRLSDSHHALARELAAGKPPAEASLKTGYSPSRISILRHSPAFQELIAFYQESLATEAIDFRERIRNFSMDVLADIAEEMEEYPERYSPGMKAELFKLTADRGGLGPESRSTNVSINVDYAARLERGLARAEAAKLIEHAGEDQEGSDK